MALSGECIGRLENWKFAQARTELRGDASDDERELVEALAEMLGDSGWLLHGHLSTVVSAALSTILGDSGDPDAGRTFTSAARAAFLRSGLSGDEPAGS